MFDALLALFKPRPRQAAAAKPAAARAASDRREPPPAAETTMGVGARRPLVSPSGVLAGFEFHTGGPPASRLRRASDAAVARAYAVNVLGAMRLCANQSMTAFARLPAAWLVGLEDDALFAPGMAIDLLIDANARPVAGLGQLVERLRRLKVRVGWQPPETPGEGTPPGRPDFMVVGAPPSYDLQGFKQVIAATAYRWPGVEQVLLDAPDVDLMEALLRPPVSLAACAIGPNSAPPRIQALPPQAQHLLRLLNRIVRDDDNALLVADIKADAAICLRLLQYLNSAGASPGRPLDSIDQAVMVLGRDALYGWVAQMLVRMAPLRPAAAGLQAMALARARLFENLARGRGEASPGSLYLLGLTSMLPLLLQCSLADAIESLRLPEASVEALRLRTGPWAPYLELVETLERQDMAGLEPLAQGFGGLEAVLGFWAQAWLG